MTADSGLGQIVKRYLAPRNSGEFWAMVAVFIAILALAISTGQRAGNQTITKTINHRHPRSEGCDGPAAVSGTSYQYVASGSAVVSQKRLRFS